ncbi:MAG: hypothetical protein ACREMK_04440 [Gemmatimonadota bacterium]
MDEASSEAASLEAGPPAGASRTSGAPQVGDPYQDRIDEAWQKAVAGENPAYACASLKGRASMGSDSDAATRAMSACNVDIPVRYFATYIDRVEAGDRSCLDLVMEVTTKLPAMTISMEAFPEIADRGSGTHESDDAPAGAAAVLAARGSSEDVVKDRLRRRISEVCPDEAGVLLGRSPPEPTSGRPERLQALGEASAAAFSDPLFLETMARMDSVMAEIDSQIEEEEAAYADAHEVQYDRGKPRDDLARFHGLYGDPGDAGPAARRLWVADACGYLAIGATWGDAMPWVMRSISDTAFIAATVYPGVEPFKAEFRMAADGRAETLTHNGILAIGNSLPRVGELPEGWDAKSLEGEGCDHQPR